VKKVAPMLKTRRQLQIIQDLHFEDIVRMAAVLFKEIFAGVRPK